MNNPGKNLNIGIENFRKLVHDLPSPLATIPFDLEYLQHLSSEQALQCQTLLGHGTIIGQWETARLAAPALTKSARKFDLSLRIKKYLSNALHSHPDLERLIADATLYLTRWALVCRLGPVSFRGDSQGTSLDVSTIAQRLYTQLPQIVARGIERSLASDTQTCGGYARLLTLDDMKKLSGSHLTKVELNRMHRLAALGLWLDEPPQVPFHSATTEVKGPRQEPSSEKKREPYLPLPDWYMAQIGPCVLWLIKDLGPNLLKLLHFLLTVQRKNRFKQTRGLARYISQYFVTNSCHDRYGNELAPPFELRLSAIGAGANSAKVAHAWPPRDYADVMSLVSTLQRSHLFIALLLMAARHSEILTLERDCVQVAADGHARVQGKTFKATVLIEGKDRKWPAPSILIYAIAQQLELLRVVEQLSELLDETVSLRTAGSDLKPDRPTNDSTHLWCSLGITGTADVNVELGTLDSILPDLARAVGMDEKPGGINFQPHRMRKTMARLAGIAIDGSQKVLMQLLGHEDVTTTLYYMQSDPGFRQEVEDVLREMRLLRMEEAIECVRGSVHEPQGLLNGGLGGGGATVLTQTVVNHEEWLHQQGREWAATDARELAVLLADNGQAARLIAPGVMCTKSTHEKGLCNSRMGAITPGNCKVECHSHIELAAGRRDVQRVIPILVQHTTASIENADWLAAIHLRKQLIHEISRFPDIGDEWRVKPEVQSLLVRDLEGGA